MYYMDCFSAVIKYLMWIGCAFCEIINRLITSTPLCIIKLEWCGVPFLKVSDTFSLRGCLLTIFDVFVYFFLMFYRFGSTSWQRSRFCAHLATRSKLFKLILLWWIFVLKICRKIPLYLDDVFDCEVNVLGFFEILPKVVKRYFLFLYFCSNHEFQLCCLSHDCKYNKVFV